MIIGLNYKNTKFIYLLNNVLSNQKMKENKLKKKTNFTHKIKWEVLTVLGKVPGNTEVLNIILVSTFLLVQENVPRFVM